MRQIMRSSLDYAGFAQLCRRSPIMREIMRAHNRIIPRSLELTMAQCMRLSVSSQSSIELAGWIELVFSMEASFDLSYTHTHTHLTALCPGWLTRWAGTRKVKPIWILLKQETLSGSGISWDICMSAPCSRQITMPTSYHSVFLQAGCPSCRPTNSVKAMKEQCNYLVARII